MRERGLCLEEYVELLRTFHYPGRLLEAAERPTRPRSASPGARDSFALPDAPYQVSGNNVDGYIYTLWRKPA